MGVYITCSSFLCELLNNLPTSIMEYMNILPPGFRFYPTDEELINDYLKKKISVSSNPFVSMIADIDLYKFDPWQLPRKAYFGEKEWFFFSPRDRKYPNGARPNRAAASGYWKATGTDKPILSQSSQCIGVKKALVFYEGRAPNGMKTNWMMYEYRLMDNTSHYSLMQRGSMRLDDWVLCRIRQKTVPPEPKPEINIKKKAKRPYDDAFKVFMEDEIGENNISFLKPNGWQPQYCYEESDQGTILDFTESTSSPSHSISYDNYECQMSESGWTNEDVEGNKTGGFEQNKKFCHIDSSGLLNNNPFIFHKLPTESSTY